MNAPLANPAATTDVSGVPQHESPRTPPGHRVDIKIFVNDDLYVVHESHLTGRQLKALAGVAEANQLFVEVPGPHDDLPVHDDVQFALKSGMKFYDVPAGNLGAR